MTLLTALLAVAIRAMIFALGLRSTRDDLLYLWRRPALLVRSLFAMYVAVPLAAVVMVKTLPLPRPTAVALLVLGISAGAPLVPRRILSAGGNPPYVLSLAVASSVLAVASVPASVAVLDVIFEARADVRPEAVAWLVAKSFLLPFLAGVAVHALWPSLAARIVTPVTNAASVLFSLCAAALIVALAPMIRQAGLPSFAALAALTTVALAVGHLLGGPHPADRVALAVLSATRHIGLVLLIAATTANPDVMTAVAAYIAAALVVSTPYVVWVRRHYGRGLTGQPAGRPA